MGKSDLQIYAVIENKFLIFIFWFETVSEDE